MNEGKGVNFRLSVDSAEAKRSLQDWSDNAVVQIGRARDALTTLGRTGAAANENLGAGLERGARGLGAFGAAADTIEGRIKGANRSLGDLRGAFELIGGGSSEATKGMGALGQTIGNVADVFGVLSAAFLKNPIGLVAVGVTAAAGAWAGYSGQITDAKKVQDDLNASLKTANELLETQAERQSRVVKESAEKAATDLRGRLGEMQRQLVQIENDLGYVENRGVDLGALLTSPMDSAQDEAYKAALKRAADLRREIADAAETLRRLRTPSELGANRDAAAQEAEKLDKQNKTVDALEEEARTRAQLIALAEDQRRIEEARAKAISDAAANGFAADSAQAQRLRTAYESAAVAENERQAKDRIAKLEEQSRQESERARALEEKREVSLDRYIDKLERDAALAGQSTEARAEALAIAEAQSKLMDDQGRQMRDLTDLEKQRIANAVRTKEAIEEQQKAAEKLGRDMERAITRSTDRAVDYAADTLYDGFTGKITSVGEFLKTTLLRAASQAMAEMVLRPVIAPIISAGVQAAVGAGLGSAFGVSGGGAAAASSAGSGIGLGTVAGAGAVGYGFATQGNSFWNALGNPFGLGLTQVAPNAVYTVGHSATALTAAEAAQEAVAAGASAGAGTGAASGVLGAIAPYLAIGGGLFSAYNFAKNPTLTNGIAAAGGLYAGTSAFLGLTGLGPALPFAGPIGLAAAAIGLIGSLFGGKKKNTVVHADQTGRTIGFMPDGSIADYGGNVGYYGANPSSYDYIGDVGKAIRSTIETLGGKAPGFVLGAAYDSIAFPQGLGSVNVTDAQGRWGDGYSPFPGIGIRTGEGMAVDALKVLLPLSEGIDEVYKAVARNSAATKIEDFAKDLDFAKNLKDSIGGFADLGAALKQVTAQAKATAVSMVDSFDETFARAESLGIGDTAKDAIAETIREWIGAQGPQVQPSAVQTMLAQIDGAFAGVKDAAAKYGLTPAEVGAANDNAVQKVRDQFAESIAAILDPAGAALRAFDKSADQMRQDARDLGVDLVDVEKAIAKQRADVQNQALGGVANSVRDFLSGQPLGATSSLSPAARLAEAQRQFEANLAGLREGDAFASARLAGSAQTALDEGRAYYGSTANFALLEAEIRNRLQSAGVEMGWDGFGTEIQTQTTALIGAQNASTLAVVASLEKLREQVARQQNELSRLLSLALAS